MSFNPYRGGGGDQRRYGGNGTGHGGGRGGGGYDGVRYQGGRYGGEGNGGQSSSSRDSFHPHGGGGGFGNLADMEHAVLTGLSGSPIDEPERRTAHGTVGRRINLSTNTFDLVFSENQTAWFKYERDPGVVREVPEAARLAWMGKITVTTPLKRHHIRAIEEVPGRISPRGSERYRQSV
ncbi:hypothetical protein JCM10207_000558 [Rhodosporidiobolus poonsookiae]